jgi:hypothetical protein
MPEHERLPPLQWQKKFGVLMLISLVDQHHHRQGDN